MVFNYEGQKWTEVKNFKGGTGSVFMKKYEDELNKVILMRVPDGSSVGFHRHEGSSEIIYFIEGSGKVAEDGTEKPVHAGMSHYCPEGCEHGIINDSGKELLFFATVPVHRKLLDR